MSFGGIDVREEGDRLVFRASLKDSAGAKVTTGTTEIRLYRYTSTGTLEVYDWTADSWVATGSGTPDDEETMTHQNRRDSSAADVATGLWTKTLTNLGQFEEGRTYVQQVTNTNATPESQERDFTFGGSGGGERLNRAVGAIIKGTVGNGSSTTSIVTSSLDPAITATDQFKPQIVCFERNTTTTDLRGHKAVATAITSGGVISVSAMPAAPVSGDKFVLQ